MQWNKRRKNLFYIVCCLLLGMLSIHSYAESLNSQYAESNGIRLEYVVRAAQKEAPTVLFEAGFGTPWNVWQPVIDKLPAEYGIFAYSRAGIGNSAKTEQPRTMLQHVSDLNGLLQKAGIDSPLIFVGHSYGAIIETEFASQFPDKIKALVYVDPAVMHQRYAFMQLDKARTLSDEAALKKHMPPTMLPDFLSLLEQMAKVEVKDYRRLPAVPAAILSSAYIADEPFSIEETAAGREVWLSLHAELARQFASSIRIKLATTGHNIHKQKPQLVTDVIQQVTAL
ncbi:alpha/beta fold hydrolase [Neptunicella marina]|uniref:Alpha/beta hydrolase n=1 Tax=Neptunicella marina TaxID=2125989 RepID=A0A8J6M0A1_9ALTE|nr:alpha/beta hydrolase [Neptunicella marina]MBC3767045.1 alpha/beta hydrolase [Neptunicella marina]